LDSNPVPKYVDEYLYRYFRNLPLVSDDRIVASANESTEYDDDLNDVTVNPLVKGPSLNY
jgi:hypothetical protein